jgi:transcriptional regulator
MYEPPAFVERDPARLLAFINARRLGLLVTTGPEGPRANLIPFLAVAGEPNRLLAHLARANDQLADLATGAPVLVVFQGPDAYVTPSWYPTKQDTGRVVPTWNYAVVQATGRPTLHPDPAWLMAQITALTGAHESTRPAPWAVTDAPDDFIAGQMRGIVGVEITVTALTGKWKVSQNRTAADRQGVADGLSAEGTTDMAALVAAHLPG